jgi:hypothetical protein
MYKYQGNQSGSGRVFCVQPLIQLPSKVNPASYWIKKKTLKIKALSQRPEASSLTLSLELAAFRQFHYIRKKLFVYETDFSCYMCSNVFHCLQQRQKTGC